MVCFGRKTKLSCSWADTGKRVQIPRGSATVTRLPGKAAFAPFCRRAPSRVTVPSLRTMLTGQWAAYKKVQHGTARRRVPCGAALCRPFAFSRGGRETFARHFAACKPSPPRQPSGLPRGLFCSLRRQWGRAARCRTGNLCAAAPFFAWHFSKAPAAHGRAPCLGGAFCAAPALAKGCFVLQKTLRHMLLAGAAKKRGRSVT